MKAVYALATLALATPALAQPTSEDYAIMSMKTFSLWSCTVLAARSDRPAEAEKMFTLGYETGRTFVDAVKAGKVKREDLSKHAPLLFGDKIGGMSTDFSLGMMYQSVLAHTSDQIWKDAGDVGATDVRTMKADSMYRQQNCSFLK